MTIQAPASDGTNRFVNNFDFLRLVAAIMVIFSHSYPLSGNGNEPLFKITGSMSIGKLAVAIFFIISGYLIAKSWMSHPQPTRFLWSRFLRIVPGLIGVALVSVFLLGPSITSLPLYDYFHSAMTWGYFGIVTVYGIVFNLPGVFANNPYPDAVNGSIWTLPMEVNMYLVVLALGVLGLIYKKRFLLFITVSSIFLYAVTSLHFFTFTGPIVTFLTTIGFVSVLSPITNFYSIVFLMGTLFLVYKDKIPFDLRLLALAIVVWCISLITPYFEIATFLCIPYIVLYISFMPTKYIKSVSKYGDFSYGLYIYAFPVQQTLAHFLKGISIYEMFILAVPITFVFAYLSWNLIESKALRLKNIDFNHLFYDRATVKNKS